MYELKQAMQAWYTKIDNYFTEQGFKRSQSKPTHYTSRSMKIQKNTLIVSLYVDDLIYTSNYEKMVRDFKKDTMNMFKMTDSGLMHYFLGIEISQREERIFICQKKYTESLIKKYKMEGCKTIAIPLKSNKALQKKRWFTKGMPY